MARKTEWQGVTKAYAKRVLRTRGFPLADVREAFTLAPTFRSGTHYAVSDDGRKVAWVTADGCEEWSIRIVDAEGLETGQLIDSADWLAQNDADEMTALAQTLFTQPDDAAPTMTERVWEDEFGYDNDEDGNRLFHQDAVTEVAPNVVVIAPGDLGGFLAGINADRATSSAPMKVIDRARTVSHRNGITQVFATAQADRAAGESAIGAYQRDGNSYRTYAPDGSSLGTWATETGAYNAISGKPEPEIEIEA